MLVHYNGKLNVAVANRCGHTAMCEYFNLPYNDEPDLFDEWLAGPKSKVLVIRHPIERLQSSCNLFNFLFSEPRKLLQSTKNVAEAKNLFLDIFNSTNANSTEENLEKLFEHYVANPTESMDNIFIYYAHSTPYLNRLEGHDFKIIRFERLNEYIPISGISTKTTGRTLPCFNDNNGFFTKEDLFLEEELYFDIINRYVEIDVNEWRELTNV